MIPIDFEGSNVVFSPPAGVTNIDPCSALVILDQANGAKLTVTRWKLTAEELEEFNRTKTVWLCVTTPIDQRPNPALVTATQPFTLRPAAPEDGP